MAILNQPDNINHLLDNRFAFHVKKLPNVRFFTQATNLPSITTTMTPQHVPFDTIKRPSTRANYSDLKVIFFVDEDLQAYIEMYKWIDTTTLQADYQPAYAKSSLISDAVFSDGSLMLQTSKKNYNVEMIFRDIFPIEVGGLEFTFDKQDSTVVTCTATFSYQRFDIITKSS